MVHAGRIGARVRKWSPWPMLRSRAWVRMMQRGMPQPNGRRSQGLQDLLNRLRQSRADKLGRYNLEPMLDDIKQQLDDIIDAERQSLEDRLDRDDSESGTPPDGQPSDSTAVLHIIFQLA